MELRWIDIAKEGQPKATESCPYPRHMVRLVCIGTKWERIVFGELRFFGRNPDRPNWVTADEHVKSLENDAWVVTHYLSGTLDSIEGWPEDTLYDQISNRAYQRTSYCI